MARTTIPVQETAFQSGSQNVTLTTADATNDHDFENSGNELLHIINGDVATKTVLIKSVADNFGRVQDLSLVVPAAAGGFPGIGQAGPFIPGIWNQSGGNKVNIDITADTLLKFAVTRPTYRK